MTTSVWNTQLTPLAFLRRSADVYPDKTAIVYGERRHTYAEFAAEATRIAHALRGSGVEPGDRVAYLLPNVPEMLVAHFAVPLAGAVLVAINTRLSTDEVRYILDHSGAKILVVDAAATASAAASATTTCSPAATTSRCRGPSRTRAPTSRSTTRPAPPASPRACSTTTAAPT
jgi:fatty-acyl-CoA synthase